jgi:ribosomal protein S12 methylthiotransferase accessory factor YcaO
VTSTGIDVGDDGWVAARSLISGERFAVPAGAVQSFGAHNSSGAFLATSGGSGAGSSPAHALGAAVTSVLAFDAIRRALRGAPVTGIAPDGLGADPELAFLVSSARNLGLDVELIDLNTAMPQVLARTTGATGEAVWAVGGHLEWRYAAVDALRDVIGQVQITGELPVGEQADLGDPLLRTFDPFAIAAGPADRSIDLARQTTWPALLAELTATGRDLLAVDTTTPDLARGSLATARVVLVETA